MINSLKNVLVKFKIKGNRPHIRSEKEMLVVDKQAADEAFKNCKKEILDSYLLSKGFAKYKTNSYVRKSKIDVLEYIDLQKERYGSKTFTVNYAIMPLYVPHEYIVTGFGSRLGSLICGKDIWWDYANASVAEVSFNNITEAIEKFLIPWFEKYASEELLMKKLLEDRNKSEQTGRGIPYKNAEWIKAMEEGIESKIIMENIEKLKLSKKIL